MHEKRAQQRVQSGIPKQFVPAEGRPGDPTEGAVGGCRYVEGGGGRTGLGNRARCGPGCGEGHRQLLSVTRCISRLRGSETQTHMRCSQPKWKHMRCAQGQSPNAAKRKQSWEKRVDAEWREGGGRRVWPQALHRACALVWRRGCLCPPFCLLCSKVALLHSRGLLSCLSRLTLETSLLTLQGLCSRTSKGATLLRTRT